jgi:hypothetical protein
MIPNNNSRRTPGQETSSLSFTMMPGVGGNSPFTPTHIIGPSTRDSRSSHSSRNTQSSTPSTGGRSTVVLPGQPHWFGCRVDRQHGPVSTMCRCRNPDSHGDAWTSNRELCDINGQRVTQQQVMDRMLDHYGTSTINRDEEVAAYSIVLDPTYAFIALQHHRNLTRWIRRGEHICLSSNTERMTFHNGDRHVQNHVSEHGLRTTFGQPFPGSQGGAGGGDGRNGYSRGHGSRR